MAGYLHLTLHSCIASGLQIISASYLQAIFELSRMGFPLPLTAYSNGKYILQCSMQEERTKPPMINSILILLDYISKDCPGPYFLIMTPERFFIKQK